MSEILDYEAEFKSLTQYLLNNTSPFVRDAYREWKCDHRIWEAVNFLKEEGIIPADYICGVSDLITDSNQN